MFGRNRPPQERREPRKRLAHLGKSMQDSKTPFGALAAVLIACGLAAVVYALYSRFVPPEYVVSWAVLRLFGVVLLFVVLPWLSRRMWESCMSRVSTSQSQTEAIRHFAVRGWVPLVVFITAIAVFTSTYWSPAVGNPLASILYDGVLMIGGGLFVLMLLQLSVPLIRSELFTQAVSPHAINAPTAPQRDAANDAYAEKDAGPDSSEETIYSSAGRF